MGEGVMVGKRRKNRDLPPQVIRRKLVTIIRYYYCWPATLSPTGKRWQEPIGTDENAMRLAWAERQNRKPEKPKAGTFGAVIKQYIAQELPKKAKRTQWDYQQYAKALLEKFDAAPLAEFKPMYLARYREGRGAPVRANRELAFFSLVWNWAREQGLTDLPNPRKGIRRNPEEGRKKIYVTDEQYQHVYDHAPMWMQDALDLALLLGQRPADTLKIRRTDIGDNALRVAQNKTGARIEFIIEGELKIVLERTLARPSKIASMYLIHDANGQPIGVDRFGKAFKRVRNSVGENWQFKDLRRKHASERGLQEAQEALGHADSKMTRHYRSLPARVKPLK